MLQTHRNLVAPGGGDRTTEQRGQRTNSAVEEDLVERERLWLDDVVVRLGVAYIIFPHGHRNRSVLGGEINERLQSVQLIMSWLALFGGGPPLLPPPPLPPPPRFRCGSILICETSLQYGQLTQTSPEELEGRFRARIFRHDPHRIRRNILLELNLNHGERLYKLQVRNAFSEVDSVFNIGLEMTQNFSI